MEEATLFWTKVAAIGQVAGAIATAAAVIVSLWIAFHGRKPRLKLTVGMRGLCGFGLRLGQSGTFWQKHPPDQDQ